MRNLPSFFFISWIESDILYIVETSQLKLILKPEGLHHVLFRSGCHYNKASDQRSCLCGIASSAFDFLMCIFGYCFLLIDCQIVILSSFSGSNVEDSEHTDPILSINSLSAAMLPASVVSFTSEASFAQIRLPRAS